MASIWSTRRSIKRSKSASVNGSPASVARTFPFDVLRPGLDAPGQLAAHLAVQPQPAQAGHDFGSDFAAEFRIVLGGLLTAEQRRGGAIELLGLHEQASHAKPDLRAVLRLRRAPQVVLPGFGGLGVQAAVFQFQGQGPLVGAAAGRHRAAGRGSPRAALRDHRDQDAQRRQLQQQQRDQPAAGNSARRASQAAGRIAQAQIGSVQIAAHRNRFSRIRKNRRKPAT
jgi:hypothetical protein